MNKNRSIELRTFLSLQIYANHDYFLPMSLPLFFPVAVQRSGAVARFSECRISNDMNAFHTAILVRSFCLSCSDGDQPIAFAFERVYYTHILMARGRVSPACHYTIV